MNEKKIFKYILIILAIFIPLREIIAYFTNDFIKFIPDILIWGGLIINTIKNRFKINLKIYDILFIIFIGIGFVSCLVNSVSLLAFALQVRSIGTMYVLFYLIRTIRLEKKDYDQILNTLVTINSLIIVVAIFEFLSNKILFFPQEWANSITYSSNLARTYSLMKNPNTFAMFSFMVMFLHYYKNESNVKWSNLMYYLLVFLGVLLSASRSTLIVVILFLVFVFLKSIYNKYFNNFILILCIFIMSFFCLFGLENIKKNENLREYIYDIIYNEKDDIPFVEAPSDNNNETSKDENKQESEKDENNSNSNSQSKPTDNKTENKTEGNSGNIVLLDRWEETTSGVTMENSQSEGRIYNIKKGLTILKDYPIIGTGFGTYGSAGSMMVTPKLYEKYNLIEDFYSDNEYIKVIVESGIIGTIVFAAFCISLIYCHSIKKKNIFNFALQFSFLFIGLFYNVFELQVFCFVYYLGLVYIDDKIVNDVKNKKISFLSLHLGTGGIEQAIVNTANMLSQEYEIEIITLYNNHKPVPFKMNNNIKVKYLMNTISNRSNIKKALKNKKIINLIKETIKAFFIIISKKRLLVKAIANCDSSIIISTRYDFSKLLNDFGHDNQYKIHQEHTFSISEKYIKRLNRLTRINCIMPCSKVLKEYYSGKINLDIKFIPLALERENDEGANPKLNNKNIISIGRLEKEKGFEDLLEIIYKMNDKDVFLNLFGDGSLMETLKNKSLELGIEKQVKFWGFQTKDFIKKHMLDSSLYVMTSYEESFGLVLIEALSYGIPCIAYDSAEGAKYTINNKNGFFIKNRNEKKMIESIKKYFNLSQKDKEKMSSEAKNSIISYKYDTIKKEWLTFVKNILEAEE